MNIQATLMNKKGQRFIFPATGHLIKKLNYNMIIYFTRVSHMNIEQCMHTACSLYAKHESFRRHDVKILSIESTNITVALSFASASALLMYNI